MKANTHVTLVVDNTAQQTRYTAPVLPNGSTPNLRWQSRSCQNPAKRWVLALSYVD